MYIHVYKAKSCRSLAFVVDINILYAHSDFYSISGECN